MWLTLESTFNLVYWDSPSTSGSDETYSRCWQCPIPCSRTRPPSPSASPSRTATAHRSDLVLFSHCYFKVVINVLLLTPFSMWALAERCTSKNLQFSHTEKFSVLFSMVYSFFQKCRDPSYSFLTSWEAKACSPFFCGWKSCAKGEHLQVRFFFYGVKLNDNCKSVLCACLITYFLCPKGKKRKAQCVFRQPMETFLVRWVFIGTL